MADSPRENVTRPPGETGCGFPCDGLRFEIFDDMTARCRETINTGCYQTCICRFFMLVDALGEDRAVEVFIAWEQQSVRASELERDRLLTA